MFSPLDRRDFLRFGTTAGIADCTSVSVAQTPDAAEEKIVIGIMGANAVGPRVRSAVAAKRMIASVTVAK
jgi:hypothetical protein